MVDNVQVARIGWNEHCGFGTHIKEVAESREQNICCHKKGFALKEVLAAIQQRQS